MKHVDNILVNIWPQHSPSSTNCNLFLPGASCKEYSCIVFLSSTLLDRAITVQWEGMGVVPR